MTDITPTLSSVLVSVHSSAPIQKHVHSSDRLDSFLREAYRIVCCTLDIPCFHRYQGYMDQFLIHSSLSFPRMPTSPLSSPTFARSDNLTCPPRPHHPLPVAPTETLPLPRQPFTSPTQSVPKSTLKPPPCSTISAATFPR